MSYFFSYLGDALAARGARVRRVLVCPGDWLFWTRHGAVSYRGTAEGWPGWLARHIGEIGATDIVCLGDGRRWHDEGLPVARAAGLRVHVIEQGYLRPHFLTVEPEGTGGRSQFPRDWPAIEALAGARVEAPRFETSFLAFSVMDVGFQLANVLTSWAFYPRYRQHALDPPLREWAGWIWNKALPIRRRRADLAAARARVEAHEGPLYLLPLQLETDYQIRLHGPPQGLRAALDETIASFAAHAPEGAVLAVKPHPLDNGWTPWRRLTEEAAARAGCADRVAYLDGGPLDDLLPRAAGVVVMNSTVGLSALRAGAPVIALGTAIYDLPRLTFQDGLDAFWRGAAAPEARALATFLSALMAIQVPGGFDGTGARPGAAAMAERMLAPPTW